VPSFSGNCAFVTVTGFLNSRWKVLVVAARVLTSLNGDSVSFTFRRVPFVKNPQDQCHFMTYAKREVRGPIRNLATLASDILMREAGGGGGGGGAGGF
jgi:hypothetical protein